MRKSDYVVLWLLGACLRLTILALPPVLPMLHAEFSMTESQVGLLGSLPPLLFALAAVPGAALIARLGVGPALIIGLVVIALGSGARGAANGLAGLYGATIAMAAGVAVMQPALAALVRRRFAGRIGFATAVYMNGLLVGEIFAASLTIPWVLPLLDRSWRASFVFWTLPVVVTAVLAAAWLRAALRDDGPGSASAWAGSPPPVLRWWPDFRNPLVWRLGFLLGSVNALYFVANAFLPDYMTAQGRPDLVGPALTALNVGQLPAAFLMLAAAGRLVRRPSAYVVTGALSLACVIGIMASGGWSTVAWCGLLGFVNAITLVLAFALPPILADPADVARTSAGMFTISYGGAMLLSIAGGLLWDETGWPPAAFLPIACSALLVIGLASTVRPSTQIAPARA